MSICLILTACALSTKKATLSSTSEAITTKNNHNPTDELAKSDKGNSEPIFVVIPDPEHNTLSTDLLLDPQQDSFPSDVITHTSKGNRYRLATIKQAPDDLWERLRNGMALPDHFHRRTKGERVWYAKHQSYLDRTFDRARPYLYYILNEIERRHMPAEIALLPVVESAFQPFAYSHGRAAGIWQFIPATGKLYGMKQNWWYDGRRDIGASTRGALNYLQNLHKLFKGDWLHALAAYNSGSGTVQKAIRYNRKHGRPTDFWSLKLPKETSAYVPKLLAISAIVAEPNAYHVKLKSIPNRSYLAKVDTLSQIDIALAAELAEISVKEIYMLNPGYNQWATDPDGPHSLFVPIEKASLFEQGLAALPANKRIQWKRYRIKEGETLGHIAIRYRTTVTLLREVNKIRGNTIRAGKNLIIPVATKNINNYALTADRRLSSIQNSPKKGLKVSYIVNKGDSLWEIARKYDVTVEQVAKWNGMAPRDMLREGQRLVIWWTDRRTTLAKIGNKPSIGLSQDTITQKVNYTVRRGDSLARISQKFKVTISKLRLWNSLPKGKYLQPGQKLKLFVDVTRQAGNI